MAKFPSEEWANEYVEKLNSSPSYQDAGKLWEGDITFVIQPDENFKETAYLYLDLYHGKCRGYRFSMNPSDLPKSEFSYMGKFGTWKRLINKEIDPIQGVLTGKFKLDGPMMKIMRFTKAAKEMVNTASQVNTEF
jgi:Putative sterol carrier protein